MISIVPFSADRGAEWDEFVRRAKNGTFLFERAYMDYHSDRFTDRSLMAYDGHGRVVAVLPASGHGVEVRSHGGLTYGGWVMALRHFDANVMLEVWDEMRRYYSAEGFRTLLYKPVPYIYAAYPSEEDLYAIFRHGGRLAVCNISSTVDLTDPIPFNELSRRGVAKARSNGLRVAATCDWAAFWRVLNDVLLSRHGVAPVHSRAEMERLAAAFPGNIRLHGVYEGDELIAGTVIYECGGRVAHAQYIAATERGRELRALPLLFNTLMAQYREAGFRYFDFGISNEDGGRYLNAGLLAQKSGFGGRGVAYNMYEINLQD